MLCKTCGEEKYQVWDDECVLCRKEREYSEEVHSKAEKAMASLRQEYPDVPSLWYEGAPVHLFGKADLIRLAYRLASQLEEDTEDPGDPIDNMGMYE